MTDEQKNMCVKAMCLAYRELNAIRARDGAPYTHNGIRSSVSEEYFSSVVDGLDAAVLELTGKHAHTVLFGKAGDG